MNVLEVARTIGLAVGQAAGTIDEDVVLHALARLAHGDPGNEDLFRDAAARVRLSRSAGLEAVESGSLAAAAGAGEVQLRYRSEMADVFVDLAIDVSLREQKMLSAAST